MIRDRNSYKHQASISCLGSSNNSEKILSSNLTMAIKVDSPYTFEALAEQNPLNSPTPFQLTPESLKGYGETSSEVAPD